MIIDKNSNENKKNFLYIKHFKFAERQPCRISIVNSINLIKLSIALQLKQKCLI